MKIELNKISSFEPLVWAPFRGETTIFDNPGPSLAVREKREMIACDTSSEELKLYAALKAAAQRMRPAHMKQTYRFCPLPETTYHVTLCDGLNASNAGFIAGQAGEAAQEFLDGLPDTLPENPESCFGRSPFSTAGPITFRFKELAILNESALVALLEPAHEESRLVMRSLEAHRTAMDRQLVAMGKPAVGPFAPHVSMGYFASRTYAPLAVERLPHWTSLVKEESLRDAGTACTITFRNASIYGFTDMVTFWRGPSVWSVHIPEACEEN